MKIEVGNIPFIYAPLKKPNNPGNIPDSLPFSLEVRNGVISQVKNEEVEKALDEAYRTGSSISGQMDDFGNGKQYADEFLDYIKTSLVDIEGKKILEIGCGTGYLLSELEKMGADCVGVEPGDSAEYGKKKFGIKIIREYFNFQAIG